MASLQLQTLGTPNMKKKMNMDGKLVHNIQLNHQETHEIGGIYGGFSHFECNPKVLEGFFGVCLLWVWHAFLENE